MESLERLCCLSQCCFIIEWEIKWYWLQVADIKVAHQLQGYQMVDPWLQPRPLQHRFWASPWRHSWDLCSTLAGVCLAKCVALGKSTSRTLNWKTPAQMGTGVHPSAVVVPGIGLQLPWSPLWISAQCLRALHPPSPAQGRLKHWLHALWTYYFPCLDLCTCRYKRHSLSFRKRKV